MKSIYRTTFADGSHEDVEAENSQDAKIAAKNARTRDVDPSLRLDAADRARHPRIKVAGVRELTDQERAEHDRAASSSSSTVG